MVKAKKAPATLPEIKEYRTTVTPYMAEEWLGRNAHNRNISERYVEELKQAILRDEWVYNGDAIRFDTEGNLLDGQHRLWAVVFAERPVDVLVVENLPRDTVLTIDVGRKRNLASHLKMAGYANPVLLAAMINMKWRLDRGLVRSNQTPTFPEALRVLEENKTLVDATPMVSKYRQRLKGSSSAVGMCFYEFSQRDADAAVDFFEGMITGENLPADDPRYVFRRYVEKNNPGTVMFTALLIKAWNAYMEGSVISHLVWRPVGRTAESFPEIQGG